MGKQEEDALYGELKGILGDSVSDNDLRVEIDKYLNKFSIEYARAKSAILKKYSNKQAGTVSGDAVAKKIGDLNGSETSVNLTVSIVFSQKKEVVMRGAPRTIVSGIIGDESGTCSFTVWEGKDVELEKGAVYIFRNAYTKLWNEKVQVNMGSRGAIEKAPAGVAVDVPDRVITTDAREITIGEIREGMGSVTVRGKVLSSETRNVIVKDEPKTVYSGIIADGTGKIQFSAWNDFGIKEGESLMIKNAYIRAWKGIPQLNLGDRCEVDRIDDTFGAIENLEAKQTLAELVSRGGAVDVVATGTVVDLRQGSGLIQRCPECNRSILNGICTAHGTVDPKYDIRMKLVIDDGTAAISSIVNRADTEKLTGITLEKALEMKAAKDAESVAREFGRIMIMKKVALHGNIMSDDYGPNMIVHGADIITVDVQAEAKELLEKVEAVL